jgi:hypothetical protein
MAGELRALARARGLPASVGTFHGRELVVQPHRVVHTSHPTFAYEIQAAGRKVVWAPEFWEFPSWARDADLMFAEAASWDRPIRFAGGVDGAPGPGARRRGSPGLGVRRLVFAHIGRPTIQALDRGRGHPSGRSPTTARCSA